MKTIFYSAQFANYSMQIKRWIHRVINMAITIFVPFVIYVCAFFFGITFSPLTQSPLLHFVGGTASLVINLCALAVTFCFGFVTGIFEFMQESLQMFPFAQPQMRVVIGLIFVTGLIRRFINILVGGQVISGSMITTFVPIASGIVLFFGADWLNSYYDLQLSGAERIYIGLGYPVFYYFQAGREIKIRRQRKPDWRDQ